MPPPELKHELMASDIIKTLLAGHHVARPDLLYPESCSDMTWAVIGLLQKYDVKLRPLPRSREDLYHEL